MIEEDKLAVWVFSILASICVLACNWLYGNKSLKGPILGLVGQVPWLGLIITAGAWGLLLSWVPMTFIHTRNLRRWIQQRKGARMRVSDSGQLSRGFVQWILDTGRERSMFQTEVVSKADFDSLMVAGALLEGPFCDPPNHKTKRPYVPPEKDNRMAWGVKADQSLVCAWIQGEHKEGGP